MSDYLDQFIDTYGSKYDDPKTFRLAVYRQFPFVLEKMGSHMFNGKLLKIPASTEDLKILPYFSEARCFSISDTVSESVPPDPNAGKTLYPEDYFVEPLSLPFKVCWFEANDNFLFSFKLLAPLAPHLSEAHGSAIMAVNIPTGILLVTTLLAFNESPDPQIYIVSSLIPYGQNLDLISKTIKENDGIGRAAHSFLRRFLAFQKSTCAWAETKTDIRMRIGVGKNRYLHRIKKQIDVVLKKDRKAYEQREGRIVDWSHRWEVAGHWRKVDGMGKDIEGNRTIEGFTWVKDYEKGPSDKELIVKERNIRLNDSNLYN